MTKTHSIRDLAISESGFVFDPFSGGTFTVNATGHSILTGLRAGLTTREIVSRLHAEFESSPDNLEDDVREFLRSFRLD